MIDYTKLLIWADCEIITGTTLKSLYGDDGIINGDISQVDGYFFKGVQSLDGFPAWIKYPEQTITNAFCVQFWYKPFYAFPLVDGQSRHILSQISSPVNPAIQFSVDSEAISPNDLYISCNDNLYFFGDVVSWTANEWVHIGIAIDPTRANGDKIRLYINGVQKTGTAYSENNNPITKIEQQIAGTSIYTGNGIFDNFELWSYFKTDFLDRFLDKKSYSIRDSILYNIKKTLESILTENGYNQDVNLVKSYNFGNVDDYSIDEYPVLHVIDTSENKSSADVDSTKCYLNVLIEGILRRIDDEDDIQVRRRALQRDVEYSLMVDESRGGWACFTKAVDITTDKGTIEPYSVFNMTFQIEYYHDRNDPADQDNSPT